MDYRKTTSQIFAKFYGMAGHHPGTNRLDFSGNPNQDPDPGIFEGISALQNLQWQKSPHEQRSRLAELRLNKLKAASAEVCIL